MEILTRSNFKENITVRLVNSGSNLIIPIYEAFALAEKDSLDLVCVSDNDPMVVRIQNFKKLEYERKKNKKAQKSKSRTSELKEIQLKINISDHDLGIKLNKVSKFLERGDKVKLVVRLKGRERETPERSKELLNKVVEMSGAKVAQHSSLNIMIIEADK